MISIIPQCFSATDTESEYVAKGRAFITQHDTDRCTKYNADPANHAEFKGHTDAIDTLLSDKSKVKQDETASDEMIKTIITATIDKEITHFKDGSKPESRTKQTLLGLNKGDPLYGHFTILSLFEDAAAVFVTGTANIFNSTDTGEIVSQADSFIDQITKLNARITKKMFTDCLTITYDKHQIGITKVVAAAEEETLRLATEETTRLRKQQEAEEAAQRAKEAKEEEKRKIVAIVTSVTAQFDDYAAVIDQAITHAGLVESDTATNEAKSALICAVKAAKTTFDELAAAEDAKVDAVETAKVTFEQAVTSARQTFDSALKLVKAAQLAAATSATTAIATAETEEEKQERIAKEETALKLDQARQIIAKGKPVLTLLPTDYYYTDKSTYNLPEGTVLATGSGQQKANKAKAKKANDLNEQENIKIQQQYKTDLAAYEAAKAIIDAASADTTA